MTLFTPVNSNMQIQIPKYPAIPFVRYAEESDFRLRLVCFHHAGGSASVFREWHTLQPAWMDVIAVQLAGREHRQSHPAAETLEAAAREVVDGLAQLPPLPWIAFGHSLGGTIAYECLRQAQGTDLAALGLVVAGARPPPSRPEPAPTHGLPDEELARRLERFAGSPRAVLDNPRALAFFLPRIRGDFRLSETYALARPEPLSCPILCLRAVDDQVVLGGEMDPWRRFAGAGCDFEEFEGGHFFVASQPRSVAEAVRRFALSRLHLPA